MRFMGHYRADQISAAALPSSMELLEKMGHFMQEATQPDVQFTEDLQSSLGACVKLSHGQFSVSGCRYAETKSEVAPCAMIEVDSISEAIAWMVSMLRVLGSGECEIRPL